MKRIHKNPMSIFGKTISFHRSKPQFEEALLAQTKKDKNVIYGARSINVQISGPLRRGTQDYDIYAKNPVKAAKKTSKNYNKIVGSKQFYTQPALHPGTHKVMNVGADMRKGTKDDYGVVDYSGFPIPNPPIRTIRGLRYRTLQREIMAKRKSLADPAMKFRHNKDMKDLKRAMLEKELMRRGLR